jgi:hypothetical protein
MLRRKSFFGLLIVALLSSLAIGCSGGGKKELSGNSTRFRHRERLLWPS